MTTIRMQTEGLNERERLLEIMYMLVCELLNSVDKHEVNRRLLELSKVRDALSDLQDERPIDS